MQIWNTPPKDRALEENEVHVWRACLDGSTTTISFFQSLLSPEEITRAQRFYFDQHRRRWIIARGLLRLLLGRYTKLDPQLICFGFNEHGKPLLISPQQAPLLHFNVSHSGDLALYAFSWRRHVGVDVEYIRQTLDYEQIVQRSFSLREQAALHSLPLEKRRAAFYQCWTRKEAYTKARGVGLSLPLSLFDVSLLPGEPAALLESRENSQEVLRWSMQQIDLKPDYAGALVVERSGWQLQCFQWQDHCHIWK